MARIRETCPALLIRGTAQLGCGSPSFRRVKVPARAGSAEAMSARQSRKIWMGGNPRMAYFVSLKAATRARTLCASIVSKVCAALAVPSAMSGSPIFTPVLRAISARTLGLA